MATRLQVASGPAIAALTPVPQPAPAHPATSSDWRTGLPVLTAPGITLRELRLSDAPALLALLTTEEVTRFISPPPAFLFDPVELA